MGHGDKFARPASASVTMFARAVATVAENFSLLGLLLLGVTSENGKNRTVSRWHGLASRKRSFLRGFNENQIRASAGMACCFLENHSHIARLKQPSFENHENAVSRGWQLAQSRAVAGYRIS